MLWLVFVFALFHCAFSQLCVCLTDPVTNMCNCSGQGACCIGDVNICNNDYNGCVARNPLISLNKTLGCPCVQAYETCFQKLYCLPSSQNKAGLNCLTLFNEYIGTGICSPFDLTCSFPPQPTLGTIANCSLETTCDACTNSQNCQWCNQAGAGLCMASSATCVRVNPSETNSIVYSFTNGVCDFTNNQVLLNIQNANPPMTDQVVGYFNRNSVITSANVQLVGYAFFASSPDTLTIRYDVISLDPPMPQAVFDTLCPMFTSITSELYGVVDIGRLTCNSSSITGANPYTLNTFIFDTAAGLSSCPTGPGGPPTDNSSDGGGLHIGAIIGIVIGAIVGVLVLIIIIALIVFKTSGGGDVERA